MLKSKEIFKLIVMGKWEKPPPEVHLMNLKCPELKIYFKFGISHQAVLGLSSVCSLISSE